MPLLSKIYAVTVRWACTILLNIILYAALWRLRPYRLRWLWLSQTVTVIGTAWNLWAYWHLSDYAYNVAWTVFDLAQAWATMGLLCELVCNAWKGHFARKDTLLACLLFVYVNSWQAEYHSWLPYLNSEGWHALWIRKYLNICAILGMFAVVYSHRSATAHGANNARTQGMPTAPTQA